jgi:hypothetical protein
MKRLIVGNGSRVTVALHVIAFVVLLHLWAAPAYSSQQVASLTEFSGTVIVQSKGDWGVKPGKGLPLYSMDKVVTRTGTAVVTFNDGAVVEIRANSNLLIEEQEKTGSVTRNLRLLLGKVIFKTGVGSKTQTNLQTPTSVAGLRGTAGTLSIGLDGKSYIQFTEGGMSYTVGDFISGVAKDVPAELADLNPAQRAAFVAAAAADQAKNAAEAAQEGKISDPQAALAAAKAAEAAAIEAKAAAESMLNNADAGVRQQAQSALDAATKALEAAQEAAKKAIEAGANPEGPSTYTPTTEEKGPGFDVETPTTVVDISTTLATTTTTTVTSTTTPSSTTTSQAPTTTIAVSGSMHESGFMRHGNTIEGELNADAISGSYTGTLTFKGKIKDDAAPPYHGSVGGNLSDGSVFQGYLSGVKGSFRGMFDSIFLTPAGDAGFLYSSLLGTVDANLNLSATGTLTRSEAYGKIDNPLGKTLKVLMNNAETPANLYMDNVRVPLLSEISIDTMGNVLEWGDVWYDIDDEADPIQTNSIDLTNGTRLGVWRYDRTGDSYSNEFDIATWTGTFGHHQAAFSQGSRYHHEQYLFGGLTGIDDLQGNLKVTGLLDYLDATYMGKIDFEYYKRYLGGDYAVAGGTMNLVKQDLGGYFGSNSSGHGGFYYNHAGIFALGGSTIGRIGLKSRPDGDYDFLAIGKASPGEASNYVINHSIRTGSSGAREGFFTGLWDRTQGEQLGALVGLYRDQSGKFGILRDYDIALESGLTMPDGDMWRAKGTIDFVHMFQQPRVDSTTINIGSLWGEITSGSFNGAGTIYGESNSLLTETRYYCFPSNSGTKPWGIYSLAMNGRGEGKGFYEKPPLDRQWAANIEGTGDFAHPDSWAPYDGMLEGQWYDDGSVIGSLDGFIRDHDSNIMGIISGTFLGTGYENPESSGEGYWIGQSIGSWEWTLGVGNFVPETLYSFDGDTIARVGEDPADIGIVEREGGYHYLALGDYTVAGEGESTILQHSRLSGNLEDGGGSGEFTGFIGSVWKDGIIDGRITAVRTTSDGGAGILLGEAAGAYFSDLGKWKAKGDLSYVPLATGLDPDSITFEEKDMAWTGIGSLVDGGAIEVLSSKGSMLSITGQDWGVWQTLQAGTYTTPASDNWAMSLTHQTASSKHWVEVEGDKWSDEQLTARAAGAWVSWDKAVTGVAGGRLKGTFNPTDATWQSVMGGANLETNQFMDMIARGQVDALQKLNIPCIQVGKATLAGSSNLMNVKMNDVTFFAYSTGASPKIWATNNVTGTYSGAPSPGHNVSLQSTSGGKLNANFSVNNWSNNKWGANVAGSGALDRTDVGGTVNVNFQGAAAGSYGNGNLSGTGSGVVNTK